MLPEFSDMVGSVLLQVSSEIERDGERFANDHSLLGAIRSINRFPRGRPFVSDYTVFARSECVRWRCCERKRCIRGSRTALDGRRLDVHFSGHVSTIEPALDERRSIENPIDGLTKDPSWGRLGLASR